METQSFVEGMPNFDGLVSSMIHLMSAKKNQPDISDPRLSSCMDSLQKAQAKETEQKHLQCSFQKRRG